MRRYRLHSPAPFYAGTYTSVQQKVEMCAVAHDVARKRKKLSPAAAAQEAATELGLAEDDEDIAFAEAQLLALAEARSSVGILLSLSQSVVALQPGGSY